MKQSLLTPEELHHVAVLNELRSELPDDGNGVKALDWALEQVKRFKVLKAALDIPNKN